MPIPKDYLDIVVKLLDATREGRARWYAGHSGPIITVAGSQFATWAGTDEETEVPFVSFALQSPKGEMLDSWYVDAGDAHYELMSQLYQGALRQARGIPNRLESVKKALETNKVIGEEKDVPF
jgi:hypothetical protein